jgi:arabinogalactan oligomer/maltooligosaccharide transport system permease protein
MLPPVKATARTKPSGRSFLRWHDCLPRKAGSYLILSVAVAIAIVPLWHVTVVALGNNRPSGDPSSWWPSQLNLDNFYVLMRDTGFLRWLANSLVVAAGVTVVGVFLAATAGYALSRFRFLGRMTVLNSLVVTQIFPATMLLLPIFLLLVQWQLINTFLGLMLVYLATILPFGIWQMKSFYDSVPESVEEAASMDGCTPAEVFRRVVLPVSAPGLAVTALFSFAAAWNEYVVAAIILQDNRAFTLPLGLRLLHEDAAAGRPGLFAAGALLVTIPMMALYLMLSRLFLSRARDLGLRF